MVKSMTQEAQSYIIQYAENHSLAVCFHWLRFDERFFNYVLNVFFLQFFNVLTSLKFFFYFSSTFLHVFGKALHEREDARGVVPCDIWPVSHAGLPCYTVKNILISTDNLWRVFRILTEPVPLKCGKLATEYPWIYVYFYNVRCRCEMNAVKVWARACRRRAGFERQEHVQRM